MPSQRLAALAAAVALCLVTGCGEDDPQPPEAGSVTVEAENGTVEIPNDPERIVSIAKAMGRQPGDAVLDTVDFGGSGNYAQSQRVEVSGSRAMMMKADMGDQMAEPSFEPGETTLQMRLVGKVKFK